MQRYALCPPAVLASLLLVLVSCGSGQPAYLDRVRPLPADRIHPMAAELEPLLEKAAPKAADDLARTWHDYLGDIQVPLRQDNDLTFVYYDFSRSLDKVYLEASFAPGKKEPLTRFGTTSLFFRTYEVPKPDRLHYRYSDGTNPLPDPFHADIDQGADLWHPAAIPYSPDTQVQWIQGSSEAGLAGQDIRILLPPSYRRNLSWTYPLVLVVGLEGTGWTRPIGQLMEDNSILPVIVAAVQGKPKGVWTAADLKAVLEDRVVPWLRHRYRMAPGPQDKVLVGWGTASRVAAEVAASRPEFWPKTWIVSEDQTQAETSWNTLAPPYFRALYPVVIP